jgi:rubrerythrin
MGKQKNKKRPVHRKTHRIITEKKDPLDIDAYVECRYCGASIDRGSVYCPYCGGVREDWTL